MMNVRSDERTFNRINDEDGFRIPRRFNDKENGFMIQRHSLQQRGMRSAEDALAFDDLCLCVSLILSEKQ